MRKIMTKKTTTDAKKEKLPKVSKVFSTKESAEKAYKEQVKRVIKTQKIKLSNGTVNVYKADFNEIDDTIEELKKEARKQGTSGYACNNIYLILQDALKKVALAGN